MHIGLKSISWAAGCDGVSGYRQLLMQNICLCWHLHPILYMCLVGTLLDSRQLYPEGQREQESIKLKLSLHSPTTVSRLLASWKTFVGIFFLSTVKNAIILVLQLDYYKRCTLLAWEIKIHNQLMSTRQQYICRVVPLPSLKQAWGVIKIAMFVVARMADSTHRFDACPIWSSESSTHFCTPPTCTQNAKKYPTRVKYLLGYQHATPSHVTGFQDSVAHASSNLELVGPCMPLA